MGVVFVSIIQSHKDHTLLHLVFTWGDHRLQVKGRGKGRRLNVDTEVAITIQDTMEVGVVDVTADDHILDHDLDLDLHLIVTVID